MTSTPLTPKPPDALPPADNLGRLVGHLKTGSLAAELATAYREATKDKQRDAMRAILEQRLRDAKERVLVAKA